MTPEEFYESQNRFGSLSPTDQILRVTWYLHKFQNRDRVEPADVNAFYRELHLSLPPTSVYMPRLFERRPPLLLRDRRGYFLEGKFRRQLDDELAGTPGAIVVTRLLSGLVERVSDPAERIFLDETIRCYRASAFRAAIVMAWNLAYDHLRRWLLADQSRVDAFNAAMQKRYPKSTTVVSQPDDLDEFKESQTLDAFSTAKLINKNTETILREKLRKRNTAAHPSTLKISQTQADDVIIDLVDNVVLHYTI